MPPIRIEAEKMALKTYLKETGNSAASETSLISLNDAPGTTGSASASFSGSSGNYDVIVGYFDENDGVASLDALVGGKSLNAGPWQPDEQTATGAADSQTFRRKIFSNVLVNQNASIQLKGTANLKEWARFDYIEFVPVGSTPPPSSGGTKALGKLGTFHEWHKVEVALKGPNTSTTASTNPFKTSVNVTFEGPGGNFTIPAFYDGDGKGGSSGNVWKARFSANQLGTWNFKSASGEASLNGYTGSFTVDSAPDSAPNLLKQGRLQYVKDHYLKFADGGYWLKGGSDDPENFLGSAFGGWNAKKAAIEYLSSKGVNSIYVLTNNIDGDFNDSWPWLGSTPNQAKSNSSRFDVAKLGRWEDFFNYVESKGMVLNMVLDDDSAYHSYDRNLYYREMIARFGHHPAVIWNIGEEAEENYTTSQQIDYANKVDQLDSFDHPITVHREGGTSNQWPFLGNSSFDLTSIQTVPGGANSFTTTTLPNLNTIVRNNRRESTADGRPIPIMIDEIPGIREVNSTTQLKLRSEVLYPIYLAGGNFELHYRPSAVSIQQLGPMWDDMRRARQFVQTLPFQDMDPNNTLLSNTNGNYAFAKPGVAYGTYLKNGGTVNLDLRGTTGTFQVKWYNVKTGEFRNGTTIAGGNWRSLGRSPFSGDVAASITKISSPSLSLSLAQTANVANLAAQDALTGATGANATESSTGDDPLTDRKANLLGYQASGDGIATVTDFGMNNTQGEITGGGLSSGTFGSTTNFEGGGFASNSELTPLGTGTNLLANPNTGLT